MQLSPSEGLSNIVKHYLIVERGEDMKANYRLFPDGNPGIVFHFGDPLIQYTDDGSFPQNRSQAGHVMQPGTPQPRSFVYGQLSRYNDLLSGGRLGMLVVVLQPTGLYSLVKMAAHELNDDIIKLADLFGVEAIDLEEEVLGAGSALTGHSGPVTGSARANHSGPVAGSEWNSRSASPADSILTAIQSVERFLLKKQATAANPDRLIMEALDLMYESRGFVRMEELLKQIPVTERQLERKFKEYIGTSPKKMADTIKFQHFLKLLQNHPPGRKISDVIYDGGYYDQAHLNNYFKKMVGVTPLQYKANPYLLAVNFMQVPV